MDSPNLYTMDPGYDFTNDWFVQNIPIWETLVHRYKPRRFLEIGSYEGRSACYLIEKFAPDREVELHCIDTWEGGVEHDKAEMSAVEARFDRNIRVALSKTNNPATRITKHRMHSHLALANLLTTKREPYFDVVYIDGSHQAPMVLSDAVMSFHLLKKGGLMIFDDYIWSMEGLGFQDALNMPKLAVDAFINIFLRKMLVVRNAPVYQLYAAKTEW